MKLKELYEELRDAFAAALGRVDLGNAFFDEVNEYPYSFLKFQRTIELSAGGGILHTSHYFRITTFVYSDTDIFVANAEVQEAQRLALEFYFKNNREKLINVSVTLVGPIEEELDQPYGVVYTDFEVQVCERV